MIYYNDVDKDVTEYVMEVLEVEVFIKLPVGKLLSLSRKLAYQFCTHVDKRRKYYDVQEQIIGLLRRLRCRPEYAGTLNHTVERRGIPAIIAAFHRVI